MGLLTKVDIGAWGSNGLKHNSKLEHGIRYTVQVEMLRLLRAKFLGYQDHIKDMFMHAVLNKVSMSVSSLLQTNKFVF